MAHLKLSMRVTTEGRKGPGIRSATYTFERKDAPLSALLASVTRTIAEHQAEFDTAENMNAELDKFREIVAGWNFKPAPEPEPGRLL